jgi:hypothetical protein
MQKLTPKAAGSAGCLQAFGRAKLRARDTLTCMAGEDAALPLKQVAALFKQVTAPLDGTPDDPPTDHADTLNCLAAEALLAYQRLWMATAEKNIQYAALQCRNLAELAVWTEFCCTSQANADLFKQDALRDAKGIIRALQQVFALGAQMPPEISLVDINQRPTVLAGIPNIDPLDTKFKRVSDAAREMSPLGGEVFAKLNTVLSKFIHPTAFVVKSLIPPDSASEFTQNLLVLGTSLALSVVTEIAKVAPTITGRSYPQPFAV